MQVIYQAFDGELFTNPEACLAHEKNFPKFKMWDMNGETTSPDSARVLWFSKQGGAREDFVSLCSKEGVVSDGIDGDDYYDNELYLWSDDMFQWVPIDELTIKSAMKFMESQ